MSEVEGERRFNSKGRATMKRILEAGTRIFFEGWRAGDPFRHVELKQVAEAAGLERNGLLYFWPTKEAFSEALAEHLLDAQELFDGDILECSDEVQRSRDLPVAEAVSRLASVELRQLQHNDRWKAMEHLTLFAAEVPRLRNVTRAGYLEGDRIMWEDEFGYLMKTHGRVPREPFTGPLIAAVIQALLEGAGIRQLVDPDTLTSNETSADSPFGLAVLVLIVALTRSPERSDELDVRSFVEGLLEEAADRGGAASGGRDEEKRALRPG